MWLEVEEVEEELKIDVESVAEAAEAAAVSHNRLGWPLRVLTHSIDIDGKRKKKKLFEMWQRYMQIDGSSKQLKNTSKIRIDAINKCRVNFQLTVFFFLSFVCA